MTFHILSLSPDQKIARPFNDACSHGEIAEVILSAVLGEHHRKKNRTTREIEVQLWYSRPGDYINLQNINKEEPVLIWKDRKFYVFTT